MHPVKSCQYRTGTIQLSITHAPLNTPPTLEAPIRDTATTTTVTTNDLGEGGRGGGRGWRRSRDGEGVKGRQEKGRGGDTQQKGKGGGGGRQLGFPRGSAQSERHVLLGGAVTLSLLHRTLYHRCNICRGERKCVCACVCHRTLFDVSVLHVLHGVLRIHASLL